MLKISIFLVVLIYFCTISDAKYEEPRNASYQNQWRRAFKDNDTNAASTTNDRAERLGFSTGYGTGAQGYQYPGSGVGVYSPLKIDLGGVVVGALIGIGALLIVPKLVNALQGGGYAGPGNYRSADDNDLNGITDLLSKLDNVLSQNNIDSTTCLQRAVCTYVRSSEYHLTMGTADQSDQLIHTISGNALVEYMLDGTAIKEALDNGKSVDGRDCDTIYPGCPLDRQSTMQVLTKLLPKN